MKRLLYVLILILITANCYAVEPINHFTEKINNQNGTVTTKIYSYPKYYNNNGNLETINTNFVASSDIGWDWEVKNGIYKLHVKNDGTFEINHLNDVFSLKLNGLGFYNSDTKQRVLPLQTQVNLSNPTINGNAITWTLAGGSSYRIEYINDTFKDILTIGNTAKNFLKNNKPDGWTVDNTWVGLIYDINLSKSSMVEGSDIESDGDIKFISNGKIKHMFKKAWAKSTNYQEAIFDESGNMTNPSESSLIWPRKRIIKNGKYIEAIKAIALDIQDNGNIVFNTDVTFQEGVSGYSGTIDAHTYNSSADTNNDVATIEVHNQFGSGIRRGFIKFDVSSIPSNATVSSAVLGLTVDGTANGHGGTIGLWRIFKAWTETGVTHNDWINPDNEWTTAGCANADDAGVDNSGDGTGADRKSTAEATLAESGTGVKNYTITTAVQNWVNGSWANNGLLIWISSGTVTDAHGYHSSEAATSSDRPLLSVTYTVSAETSINSLTIDNAIIN